MRRPLVAAIAVSLASAALLVPAVLLLEGAAAMWRWDNAATCLTARALSALRGDRHKASHKSRPLVENEYIDNEGMLRPLFPLFVKHGVMLGNSPFEELATQNTTTTFDDPRFGRLMRAGIGFEFGFLRSRILEPLDPLSFFRLSDSGLGTDARIEAFLDRYAFGRILVRIGPDGWRRTVPERVCPDAVAVIGDSVAFGVGVEDGETIASRLQQRTSGVQFVNLGVPGTSPPSYYLRLERFMAQRPGALRGLAYVHCENDYRNGIGPADVASMLGDFADRAGIAYRVFVYQVSMANSMPDVYRSGSVERSFSRRKECLEAARRRGFHAIDFYDIVRERRAASRSLLAGSSLYVDHSHFSREGIEAVVARIPAPPAPAGPGPR